MLHYIIQVIIYQALFFGLYEFLLKKETFFTGNRIYLLVSQIVVICLPFVHLPQLKQRIPDDFTENYVSYISTLKKTALSETVTPHNTLDFQWQWIIYLGILVSLCVFVIKIVTLFKKTRKGKLVPQKDFKLIILPEENEAFSFWNTIYLGNNLDENKKQQVIAHEFIHLKQKHSLDLLFFEILRIIFWFNPFVHLYQKRVTEVHEYLVDQKITEDHTVQDYSETILNNIFETQEISFTNNYFNQSLLLKRIRMMHKTKSKKMKQYNYLIAIPVSLLLLTYVACSKDDKKKPIKLDSVSLATNDDIIEDLYSCQQITPKFDKTLDNFLKINNENGDTDAVVKLVNIDKTTTLKTIYRIIYIEKGTSFTMRNIPSKGYHLDIEYGNKWKNTTDKNGNCTGKFTENAEKEENYDIIDFTTVKTKSGTDVPSYEISLDPSSEH